MNNNDCRKIAVDFSDRFQNGVSCVRAIKIEEITGVVVSLTYADYQEAWSIIIKSKAGYEIYLAFFSEEEVEKTMKLIHDLQTKPSKFLYAISVKRKTDSKFVSDILTDSYLVMLAAVSKLK